MSTRLQLRPYQLEAIARVRENAAVAQEFYSFDVLARKNATNVQQWHVRRAMTQGRDMPSYWSNDNA